MCHDLSLPDVTSLRGHLETAFPGWWAVGVSDPILFSFYSSVFLLWFWFLEYVCVVGGSFLLKGNHGWEAGHPVTIFRMKRSGQIMPKSVIQL